MKYTLFLIFFIMAVYGCSFSQGPSWIARGEYRFDLFKSDFLTDGEDSGTESEFAKSVEAIKQGGDLDLLQKAWLTRAALQVAVLKDMDEGDYSRIASVESFPENETFYKFLKGDTAAFDISLLPEQYRGFLSALLKGDARVVGDAIVSMKKKPVSQLVAAGIAVRQHLENESIIQTSIAVASKNGWKSALIAWMGHLASFYESAGSAEKAADVRRRIELIEK